MIKREMAALRRGLLRAPDALKSSRQQWLAPTTIEHLCSSRVRASAKHTDDDVEAIIVDDASYLARHMVESRGCYHMQRLAVFS